MSEDGILDKMLACGRELSSRLLTKGCASLVILLIDASIILIYWHALFRRGYAIGGTSVIVLFLKRSALNGSIGVCIGVLE